MGKTGIEVDGASAQGVHGFLLRKGLLDRESRVMRGKGKVIFPCRIGKKDFASMKKLAASAKLVSRNFEARESRPKNLKEALEGKLSKGKLKQLPRAFDLLGDVAIIEIPKKLEGVEKEIGKALMQVNNSVESVFAKTGAHEGVFRNEPVKLIAGKKKEFAAYREQGCTFRISLGKVFFSPRLSQERQRISGLITGGDKVAALFAGVGPFPIVFAKNSPMQSAVAIELNPQAVEDMRHNIIANKVEGKVEAVLGDVKELSHKYAGQFGRAVMPLPKGGENFLEDAIRYIRPEGGVVHYYQFVSRKSPFTVPLAQIKKACADAGRGFKILLKKKVRDYSAGTIQVVVDFRVWN